MYHVNKCAHAPCGCPVGEGEKYCSAVCEDSGGGDELICTCGHRGCTQEKEAETE
jgi:hypothetical protein